MQMGWGCHIFRGEKSYECARFNDIRVNYEGVGGGQISRKKRCVKLEWPLMGYKCALELWETDT